jgi:hypothetical protein
MPSPLGWSIACQPCARGNNSQLASANHPASGASAAKAAFLRSAAIVAEDAAKTETTDLKQEQSSEMMGMKGMMGKEQMMSNWKDQDAELDKLVAKIDWRQILKLGETHTFLNAWRASDNTRWASKHTASMVILERRLMEVRHLALLKWHASAP